MPMFVDGQGPIEVVVDTGSSFINIASETCAECDTSRGSIAQTPQSPSSSGSKSSTEQQSKDRFFIKYGSQHDAVEQRIVDVAVGSSVASANTRTIQMPVFVTTDRKRLGGSMSNFNICGLLDRKRGGQTLEKLVPRQHRLTLTYHEKGGTVGSLHDNDIDRTQFTIVSRWTTLAASTLPYYAVRITGIAAGTAQTPVLVSQTPATASAWRSNDERRKANNNVTRAVIDTGSNVTSFPPNVFDALRPHLARNETIFVFFEGSETPLVIPWQNYRYQNNKRGLLMINNDVHGVHTIKGTMMFGSYAFRNSTIVFGNDHFMCRQFA